MALKFYVKDWKGRLVMFKRPFTFNNFFVALGYCSRQSNNSPLLGPVLALAVLYQCSVVCVTTQLSLPPPNNQLMLVGYIISRHSDDLPTQLSDCREHRRYSDLQAPLLFIQHSHWEWHLQGWTFPSQSLMVYGFNITADVVMPIVRQFW